MACVELWIGGIRRWLIVLGGSSEVIEPQNLGKRMVEESGKGRKTYKCQRFITIDRY